MPGQSNINIWCSTKMKNNFAAAIRFTLGWETGGDPDGAYTNDPADPGGETRWGIAKRFHPDVDIKNLTREGAEAIYQKEYWEAAGCDDLPAPLDIAVFDSAVNPGAGWEKINSTSGDWKKVLFLRVAHYGYLAKETPAKVEYLGGWLDRVMALWSLCLSSA